MGLGYPGGPEIEKAAVTGNDLRFKLPRPMFGRPNCHFSFSGLKTAVRTKYQEIKVGGATRQDISDLCASFQRSVSEVIADRSHNAIDIFLNDYQDGKTLVISGGVAANQKIREILEPVANERGLSLIAPPQILCTDNGAMIAWAGIERLKLNLSNNLDFAPRPRWPLDPQAPPAVGVGFKA